MQIRELFTDDDAVSPVIGVILMVAITVILAAVIGAFVLNFGSGGPSAPSTNWDSAENGSSAIDFTLQSSGKDLDAANLNASGAGTDLSPESGTIRAGDTMTANYSGTGTVSITWSDGGTSTTLAEHQVS